MYGFPRNNYNWIFQKNMTTKLNDLKHDCVAIMMNFVAQARWAWCTFIILCLHMILMWFSWQKCVCNNCSDSGYFWRIWTVKLIELGLYLYHNCFLLGTERRQTIFLHLHLKRTAPVSFWRLGPQQWWKESEQELIDHLLT